MKLNVLLGPVQDERLPPDSLWVAHDSRTEPRRVRYFLLREIKVTDLDTGRTLTVPATDDSDGITGWLDDVRLIIASFVHDRACRFGKWDDGSPITAWEAARLLWLMVRWCGKRYKKKWFKGRGFAYAVATWGLGCKKAKANGWW